MEMIQDVLSLWTKLHSIMKENNQTDYVWKVRHVLKDYVYGGRYNWDFIIF